MQGNCVGFLLYAMQRRNRLLCMEGRLRVGAPGNCRAIDQREVVAEVASPLEPLDAFVETLNAVCAGMSAVCAALAFGCKAVVHVHVRGSCGPVDCAGRQVQISAL